MRPKASSMVKFGYTFLVINVVLAAIYHHFDDKAHAAMFLGGACVWVIGILIWDRAAREEKEHGK